MRYGQSIVKIQGCVAFFISKIPRHPLSQRDTLLNQANHDYRLGFFQKNPSGNIKGHRVENPFDFTTSGLDIVVATSEDLDRFKDSVTVVIGQALKEGKVIYVEAA